MTNTSIYACLLVAILGQEDENPDYTFSIVGDSDRLVKGSPGSLYDDGTGGEPHFMGSQPGHTWSIVLKTINKCCARSNQAWSFGLGVEGALDIVDITTNGTVSCFQDTGPECRALYESFAELTGPPTGNGPQEEGNRGAVSRVVLGIEPNFPSEGTMEVCKIRVSAKFPDSEGAIAAGRVFFATRIGSEEMPIVPAVYKNLTIPITEENGNPPLETRDYEVFLQAAIAPDAFIRCDTNKDGKNDLADAIWILDELFLGGPQTSCIVAADCNDDGQRDVSDAVYALLFQFSGGSPPPAPFPMCGKGADVLPEECPLDSTACP